MHTSMKVALATALFSCFFISCGGEESTSDLIHCITTNDCKGEGVCFHSKCVDPATIDPNELNDAGSDVADAGGDAGVDMVDDAGGDAGEDQDAGPTDCREDNHSCALTEVCNPSTGICDLGPVFPPVQEGDSCQPNSFSERCTSSNQAVQCTNNVVKIKQCDSSQTCRLTTNEPSKAGCYASGSANECEFGKNYGKSCVSNDFSLDYIYDRICVATTSGVTVFQEMRQTYCNPLEKCTIIPGFNDVTDALCQKVDDRIGTVCRSASGFSSPPPICNDHNVLIKCNTSTGIWEGTDCREQPGLRCGAINNIGNCYEACNPLLMKSNIRCNGDYIEIMKCTETQQGEYVWVGTLGEACSYGCKDGKCLVPALGEECPPTHKSDLFCTEENTLLWCNDYPLHWLLEADCNEFKMGCGIIQGMPTCYDPCDPNHDTIVKRCNDDYSYTSYTCNISKEGTAYWEGEKTATCSKSEFCYEIDGNARCVMCVNDNDCPDGYQCSKNQCFMPKSR